MNGIPTARIISTIMYFQWFGYENSYSCRRVWSTHTRNTFFLSDSKQSANRKWYRYWRVLMKIMLKFMNEVFVSEVLSIYSCEWNGERIEIRVSEFNKCVLVTYFALISAPIQLLLCGKVCSGFQVLWRKIQNNMHDAVNWMNVVVWWNDTKGDVLSWTKSNRCSPNSGCNLRIQFDS